MKIHEYQAKQVLRRFNVSVPPGIAAGTADEAVAAAKAAFPAWSSLTVKRRAAVMFKYHELLDKHADELADIVVMENGKNKAEALASVAKGNETVEWACSLPQLAQVKYSTVHALLLSCRDGGGSLHGRAVSWWCDVGVGCCSHL